MKLRLSDRIEIIDTDKLLMKLLENAISRSESRFLEAKNNCKVSKSGTYLEKKQKYQDVIDQDPVNLVIAQMFMDYQIKGIDQWSEFWLSRFLWWTKTGCELYEYIRDEAKKARATRTKQTKAFFSSPHQEKFAQIFKGESAIGQKRGYGYSQHEYALMMFAVLRNELFTKPIDEQYMLIDVLTIYPVLFDFYFKSSENAPVLRKSFFDGLLAEEVITQVCRLAADIETAEIISTLFEFHPALSNEVIGLIFREVFATNHNGTIRELMRSYSKYCLEHTEVELTQDACGALIDVLLESKKLNFDSILLLGSSIFQSLCQLQKRGCQLMLTILEQKDDAGLSSKNATTIDRWLLKSYHMMSVNQKKIFVKMARCADISVPALWFAHNEKRYISNYCKSPSVFFSEHIQRRDVVAKAWLLSYQSISDEDLRTLVRFLLSGAICNEVKPLGKNCCGKT